jgi:hypothetical protein
MFKNDEELAEAIARGLSIKAAALENGITTQTVRNRLKEARFKQRVADIRLEIDHECSGLLKDARAIAIRKLIAQMDHETTTVSQAAARAIIDYGLRQEEITDLAQQISELRDKLLKREEQEAQAG